MRPVTIIVSSTLLVGLLVLGWQFGISDRAAMTDYVALDKEMAAITQQIEQAIENEDAEALAALNKEMRALHEKAFGLPDAYSPEVLEPAYEALRDAIEAGDFEALRAALVPGLDLNLPQGKFDDLPLTWALMADGRSVEVVQLLLDHGADASQTSKEGYTALHYIADTNFLDDDVRIPTAIAAALIDAGADIEAQQNWGWTPLHRAVMEGMAMELEALLLNGADPNVHYTMNSLPKFSRGQTPLMDAGHNTEKVRLLLAHGADPGQPSLQGEVPLAYFMAKALSAHASLVAKQASGTADEFDREYAEGFAASLVLIKRALRAQN